jgi:hypothetical protein
MFCARKSGSAFLDFLDWTGNLLIVLVDLRGQSAQFIRRP